MLPEIKEALRLNPNAPETKIVNNENLEIIDFDEVAAEVAASQNRSEFFFTFPEFQYRFVDDGESDYERGLREMKEESDWINQQEALYS